MRIGSFANRVPAVPFESAVVHWKESIEYSEEALSKLLYAKAEQIDAFREGKLSGGNLPETKDVVHFHRSILRFADSLMMMNWILLHKKDEVSELDRQSLSEESLPIKRGVSSGRHLLDSGKAVSQLIHSLANLLIQEMSLRTPHEDKLSIVLEGQFLELLHVIVSLIASVVIQGNQQIEWKEPLSIALLRYPFRYPSSCREARRILRGLEALKRFAAQEDLNERKERLPPPWLNQKAAIQAITDRSRSMI
ncbi:hypothetical protein [Gorillibacterium timonense]|uniref:hypothetical protein n=1 Tax=Gorillibacterium timonense TaxID=1689269 RepID=UPI00071D4278|nr:hypothetical protein [Gorillibacterium timonense]